MTHLNLAKGIIWGALMLLVAGSISAQQVYVQYGEASFYANKFQGRPTASGEKFKQNLLTAAHLTLPFGTMVKVTNLENNRTVTVRINDRGPFVQGRIIDLTTRAAKQLDFIEQGVVRVKVEVLPGNNETKPEPSSGPVPAPAPPPTTNQPPREFFKVEASPVKAQGYFVQIASFAQLDNMMRIQQSLTAPQRGKMLVEVAVVNKTKVYRVLLGPYKQESQAQSTRQRLSKDYPDAFVVQVQ